MFKRSNAILIRRAMPMLAAFAAALLSGCAAFSPDAGMSVVADVAQGTIKKDVVAIRTPQDAEWAHDNVRRLLRRGLTVDTPFRSPY